MGKILRKRIRLRMLMLVAGVGAIMSVVLLLQSTSFWVSNSLRLLVAFAMVSGVLSTKGVWQTLALVMLLVLLSSLTAGVTLALSATNLRFVSDTWPKVSWYLVLIGPILLTFPVQKLWSSLERLLRSKIQSARFRFVLLGAAVELFGVLDTGNLLVEPLTCRPVVVVDAHSIEECLPPALMVLLARWESLGEKSLQLMPDELVTRLTLIPFTAVAGGGLMVGIRPDSCCILIGKEWSEVDAVIGFSPRKYAEGEKLALLPATVWPVV